MGGRPADRGASLVEFALIAPVLCLIVMGGLDLARMYRLQIRLDAAAREGAAHAQLYPNDVDCTGDDDIVGRVADHDPELVSEPAYTVEVLGEDGSGNLTVAVTGCGGTTVESGERVRVNVGVSFPITTPIVSDVLGDQIEMVGGTEVEALG